MTAKPKTVYIVPLQPGKPVVIPRQSPVDTEASSPTFHPIMTDISAGISEQQWAIFKQWGCKGTDFDWFALDRAGHLGVFTTAREGPVPLPIWEHFEEFMRLRKWVAELPTLAPAVQVFPGQGNYRDWLEYALKGLFAFDFQTESEDAKEERYDLIAQPTATLNVRDLSVAEMTIWLPILDVDFASGPVVSAAHLLPFGMHQ